MNDYNTINPTALAAQVAANNDAPASPQMRE